MRLAVYALVVALAGCVTVPSAPPPAEPASMGTDEAGTPRFEGPVLVAHLPVAGSDESFVSVSPDGSQVITCMHAAWIGPSRMFASTNGGRAWRELAPPADALPGGDCDVEIGEDGSWWFVHHQYPLGTHLTRTKDGGATWSTVPFVQLTRAPTDVDRPWIEVAGRDVVVVHSPTSYLACLPGDIVVRHSPDEGARWDAPSVLPPTSSGLPKAFAGPPASGPATRFAVPIFRYAGEASCEGQTVRGVIELALSEDGGRTWDVREVVASEALAWEQMPVVTFAGALLWAGYVDVVEDRAFAIVLRSADGGASWEERSRFPLYPLCPPTLEECLDVSWAQLWMDGRPDGSVTIALQRVESRTGESSPVERRVLRLAAEGSLLFDELVAERACPLEQLGLDHDASGRAFMTLGEHPCRNEDAAEGWAVRFWRER